MQIKNLKYIITYFLFIVFFFLGALFYRQSFLAVLLILMCILPILSIGITGILYRKIAISIVSVTPSVDVGSNILVAVNTDNTSFFPFLNCELFFTIKNLFYKNDIEHIIALALPAKNSKYLELTFPTKYVGLCEIDFSKITITDPLHLYTFSYDKKVKISVPVLPQVVDIEYPLFKSYCPEDDEDELVSFPGAMSHEIKDVREYIPGDNLKDIHWKLSARTDEIMVKNYDSSASRILLLLPDFDRYSINDTLSTLYSYMKFLLKKKEIFKLCLYNCITLEISDYLVSNEDELDEIFLKTYFIPLCPTKGLTDSAFESQFGSDRTYIKIYGNTITEGHQY